MEFLDFDPREVKMGELSAYQYIQLQDYIYYRHHPELCAKRPNSQQQLRRLKTFLRAYCQIQSDGFQTDMRQCLDNGQIQVDSDKVVLLGISITDFLKLVWKHIAPHQRGLGNPKQTRQRSTMAKALSEWLCTGTVTAPRRVSQNTLVKLVGRIAVEK